MSALLFPFLFFLAASEASGCVPKSYNGKENIVCVCNSTYCDDLPRLPPIAENEAIIIQTSLSGARFERKSTKFTKKPFEIFGSPTITIDANQLHQEVIGFGGAFTDAAGINMASLSPKAQENLLNAYFSKSGLEYTTGRVPIASTDFSTDVYSYDDTVGDPSLSNFSLNEADYKFKIPYIQKALELTGGRLKLFSSPWSAPGWMKTTGKMQGPGALKSDPKIHAAYAQYFVRFFEEYKKNNITFWATTTQNEPIDGIVPTQKFQAMYFSAFTQRDFIKNYLGPALQNNSLTKNMTLITLDDQRFMLPLWADMVFTDEYVSSLVSGVGVHWYFDAYVPASVLSMTHDQHPDKFILATEACAGSYGVQGPKMGDWGRAEEYANDIIEDMNNWAAGWTDWNLCLDLKGGPNWVNNVVDSPIIVKQTADEFYKQPMFYAMGHFSKFIRPGARRISSSLNLQTFPPQVVATDKNGQRVLVILNSSVFNYSQVYIAEASNSSNVIPVNVPSHSITTVLWNKP